MENTSNDVPTIPIKIHQKWMGGSKYMVGWPAGRPGFSKKEKGLPAGQPTMYLVPPIHFGDIYIGIGILLDVFSLLWVVFSVLWD